MTFDPFEQVFERVREATRTIDSDIEVEPDYDSQEIVFVDGIDEPFVRALTGAELQGDVQALANQVVAEWRSWRQQRS